jgi:hypothetical protein
MAFGRGSFARGLIVKAEKMLEIRRNLLQINNQAWVKSFRFRAISQAESADTVPSRKSIHSLRL